MGKIMQNMLGSAERGEQDAYYRLWTIQHEASWERAQREGKILADPAFVDEELFRGAYQWLMQEMRGRIPGYAGKYPLFAWSSPKPDLRSGAHLPKGTPGVRIECLVPKRRVLLSNFEAWHFILNRWFLPRTEEEDVAFEKRASAGTSYEDLPQMLQDEIDASWEHVFDLDAMSQAEFDRERVQACVEEITLAEVVRVDRFTSRGNSPFS